MTLVQLRAFLAVARFNGFTAAARFLRLSQTTVTSQVQALEEEHGIQLFERRGRRIELTAAGVELVPLARQMVALEDEAATLLEDSGALRRGALRIGAVSPFHVVEMIERHHALYPDIYRSMRLGNSETVLRDLDDYACEVGVVARSTDDARYFMKHYATYPVVAFVRRDHRLAARAAIDLAELAGEPLLMREAGSTTRRALEEAIGAIGMEARVAMEIGSREALREAVVRGLGIGTVSRSEYIPDDRLHLLPIAGDPVQTHIYVCCLRERRRNRLIASFFQAVFAGDSGPGQRASTTSSSPPRRNSDYP